MGELQELRDVVARLLAFTITHVTHEGEGDELYNELTPKLLNREVTK